MGGDGGTAERGRIAEVLFDLSLDHGFDYAVPPQLLGQVRAGMRVRVPLKDIVPDGAATIADLRIQFTGLPAGADRAGLLVRNFRFEAADR